MHEHPDDCYLRYGAMTPTELAHAVAELRTKEVNHG